MENKKARYVNVSIPEGLADAVDNYIKEHPELDLRSRAQVVNFSLRKLFVDRSSSSSSC